MAWILFLVLLATWVAGVVHGDSHGGALHFLLLAAVMMLFWDTLNRRPPAED